MRSIFLAIVISGWCIVANVPAWAADQVLIHVNAAAIAGGDGSAKFPYNNLPEAIAAARAASGAPLIKVEPGDYPLAQPLLIDRSMELRGSTEQVASGDSWPSGEAVAGTQTRVFATDALGFQPLVMVGRSDAVVISGVRIRGFIFEQATAVGIGVLLNRVQDFWIAENIFRGPAFIGMQSVASSGRVTANHFSGAQAAGASLTGGYPESPSTVDFVGNRSVRNNQGGLLLFGASINIPELGDKLNATVRDNDLSDNVNVANLIAFGLRLFILRRDLGAPGDSQSSGRVNALVQGNRIHGNGIGIVLDAGFPYRRVNDVCDSRVYSGRIDLNLAGNTVTASVTTPALVTFTQRAAALNPSSLPQWQYLHAATFAISDRDGTLAQAWIDHPEFDPFVGGLCPADVTHEPLENVLIYNSAELKGRNF